MIGPSFLAGGLAIVMIAVAVYRAGRLVAARRGHRMIERDVDVVHIAMGLGMAGMLVPRLNPLAGGAWTFGATVFFALSASWFLTRVLVAVLGSRPVGHHLAHLLASGAMLYMLDGVPGTGSMSGMSGMSGMGVGSPTVASALTVALLVAFAGQVVVTTGHVARLSTATAGGASIATGGPPTTVDTEACRPLAPRLAGGCQIAMSVTMGYMLLLML